MPATHHDSPDQARTISVPRQVIDSAETLVPLVAGANCAEDVFRLAVSFLHQAIGRKVILMDTQEQLREVKIWADQPRAT